MERGMRQFYEENADFKRYCDEARRTRHRNLSLEEFWQLAITKEVAMMYMGLVTPQEKRGSTYTPLGECV